MKDLITKRTTGANKGQPAKKPSHFKKNKPVRDREPTLHPKTKERTQPLIDLSKFHFHETEKTKAIQHVQLDGTKKTFLDARLYIKQKKISNCLSRLQRRVSGGPVCAPANIQAVCPTLHAACPLRGLGGL